MFSVIRLVTFFVVIAVTQGSNDAADSSEWWRTASFYQIYPRSFKDSNGDGIGDLKGVTEQLAYLKEIGITATWLSPIFTSPMADFGYDIANFTEIDPMFGTMEDFDEMVAKAQEVGVKIILDFVPNHSSDECEWFIKSAANDSYYKDFYVWHSGKIVNGERQPPTNWISVFRGSQWTWHEGRQQYYLHQFHRKQPDLNYRNPQVTETMKEVLRYWLRKGVAGFRVDAVPHVFECEADASGNWPDEPRNPYDNDPNSYGYLVHDCTQNQPETIELVKVFRAVLDEVKAELEADDFILMTEAYAPLDTIMQYYGNSTSPGAQIPFNFELISNLNENSNAHKYAEFINRWLDHMPEGRTANWVLGNHDQSRVSTRLGVDRIDIINMLLFTLPGCSITYMGEEIGMTNVFISWNDTVDPQACQSSPEEFEQLTRDPCRTPFQWSDTNMAGFTDGPSTWLPISEDYTRVNVKRERGVPGSHLNIYKQLVNLRTLPTMKQGDAVIKALNDNVLAIERSLTGSSTYVVLMNLMDGLETVDLQDAFPELGSSLEYSLVTDRSIRRKGDTVQSTNILLLPKEAVVLRAL